MSCEHLADLPGEVTPDADDYCADCRAMGATGWVHLRQCLTCGHVACCDSSPRRHATAHFTSSDHPVMRSLEPGETWRWCFVDSRVV
ncbi:ubiquitin-hydrolase Zn-finger-containing protein [Actinokineospora alba]|uniref:Ubiquitin-hydrolase Zn-finger-containing protein n=1 Tax=Actinokineospora alba TaxID=504798 RepID=A0A1H0PTL9_9PSEU|nr:ubiquitin-hydrolase Zn-finger-containing protein [Actinokineospora alba]SDI61809.1 ubiquitin-hydrolase Zn-finger-containing protein [Actinokineospora alba]SDP08334.1 ubiquitin-hydrolase Zn-finger-containing protein [Actinokineospora alba]